MNMTKLNLSELAQAVGGAVVISKTHRVWTDSEYMETSSALSKVKFGVSFMMQFGMKKMSPEDKAFVRKFKKDLAKYTALNSSVGSREEDGE